MTFAATLRIYMLETKYELIKSLRLPVYLSMVVAFPVLFYLLFGATAGMKRPMQGVTLGTYLLASYGVFGAIGASLSGFGVSVALERGQGWLILKRASPMPPAAYFLAKLALSLIVTALITILLTLSGIAMGGVSLGFGAWLQLLAILVLGSLPFSALGLAIGFWAGPHSAPAVVNAIYLPATLASGVWMPLELLPRILGRIAPALPPYHYAQLALAPVGANHHGTTLTHVLVLAAFTCVALALAYVGYRRVEDRAYG